MKIIFKNRSKSFENDHYRKLTENAARFHKNKQKI